jgi:hypothetical protein
MSQSTTDTAKRHWRPSEIRKLPPDERDALMRAAAAQAEQDYRDDRELTSFEAFGKDDLHGDSANTQTR